MFDKTGYGRRRFLRDATADSALRDLRRRIAATRWPDGEPVTDGSQGVPLALVPEVARHWEKDYDWRRAEAKLNALPQFTAAIDGLDIHFIHVRSRQRNARPLIVTHGWPGSILEQLKIIKPKHRSGRPGRCLPRGDPVRSRLRVLPTAHHDRLGP